MKPDVIREQILKQLTLTRLNWSLWGVMTTPSRGMFGKKESKKRHKEEEIWCNLRSRFCCMESERYKLTVLFLKTFFRSWALSVKLHTHTHTHTHRNRNRQCVSGMLSTTGTFNDPYINPVHPTAEWTDLPTAATCWYRTPCRETKLLRRRVKNKVCVCVCVWGKYLKHHVRQKGFR